MGLEEIIAISHISTAGTFEGTRVFQVGVFLNLHHDRYRNQGVLFCFFNLEMTWYEGCSLGLKLWGGADNISHF